MTAIDLWGTRLAVLSACETGVGEPRRGDGVYGLRRALVMAGAESQLMTLWQVSDRATRDLMTSYYEKPAHGRGRADALLVMCSSRCCASRRGVTRTTGAASYCPGAAGPL